VERPALAGAEIREIEPGFGGPFDGIEAADRLRIGQRGAVAGEEQVVAVIDRKIERGIVIGPAAPAGGLRGLVHYDPLARCHEPHRGSEPGQARADDVDRAGHAKP
jgi:hypothetical protein